MEISPHGYQVRAVDFGIKHPETALFLDMGLGKTVIVLTIISNLIKQGEIKGALIIAPLRVVYNVWPDELEKWDHLQYLGYQILHGPDKDSAFLIDSHIYITNYESIKWLYHKTRRMPRSKLPWDMIVFDESTAIKSRTSKRFSMLRGMRPAFKRAIVMTGTPAPNSLLDLWAQYFILDGGERLYKSWYTYRDTFFTQADYHGYKWDPTIEASKKISAKVSDITMRLKAADYLELPKLINNNIYCTMPEKVKEQYEDLEEEFMLKIDDDEVTASNAAVLSSKLRQFVSGALYNETGQAIKVHEEKLNALITAIENNPNEPTLVAIQFRFEYEIIAEKFKHVPVIYGGIGQTKGKAIIKAWNEGKLPLVVVHPKSIGHGVNLQQGGRNIIWYSIPWSWELYTQLNGRLYRQGQTKPVLIHHILLRNTIDERVLQILQRKEDTETTFLNDLTDNIRRERWGTNTMYT